MQADVHTPGATSVSFELGRQRTETISSLPGIMDTADTLLSQAGAPSLWLIQGICSPYLARGLTYSHHSRSPSISCLEAIP